MFVYLVSPQTLWSTRPGNNRTKTVLVLAFGETCDSKASYVAVVVTDAKMNTVRVRESSAVEVLTQLVLVRKGLAEEVT